jgi:nucleotide-binding universal stress UspA family protein
MINELRIKRILFATDFLQSSGLALDYTKAIARHFQATIVMVHVLKLPDAGIQSEMVTMRPCMTRLAAREQLEGLASGVRRTGISVETYVEDGFQCDVILRAVTARTADMLVLGVHGVHLGIGHYFVGSNTEKILLSAPCPTLTVGSQALAGVDPILHPKEILYFSDFTPEAEAAAPYALLLGKEFQVPVDVCQLLPKRAEADPGLCQKLSDEYRERMRRMIPEPHSNGCLPAFHLNRGMVIEEIVKRAQRQLAGLIVLGVRKRPHFGLRVHTRIAYQLLANAPCPVLTIRNSTV